MADIFNVEPPAWLREMTHSDSRGLLGQVAGSLVAGGVVAAEHAAEPNEQRNWFQLLPQSIGEAKMSLVDPMWRLKLQQAQLGIAHTALGMQEMQQNIDLNKTKLRLNAEDTAEIPKWLQDHPTVESRMSAEWPAAKTPEWNHNLDQLRARDSQSTLAKVTVSGLKELSDAVADIAMYDGVKAGELSAKIQPYAIKGQMPPPELTAQVMGARSEAETKKFERQKELYGVRSTPVAERYRNIADQEDALAEEARVKGDVESYQKHKARAEENRLNATPKTSTTETRVGPEGTVVTQTYGARAPGKTTPAAVEKSISYETALEAINDVMHKLKPGDVGVAGWVGEHVFDRWLSSIVEATGGQAVGSNERVSDRTAIRNLRELLFQAFSPERLSGTGFSNADVKRLNELANGLDPSKGYAYNMQAFADMRDLIVARAKTQGERTGQPAGGALKTADQIISDYNSAITNLKRMVDENRVTPTQAYEQHLQLHKQMQDALQRFH
jgi:hypothetical protein